MYVALGTLAYILVGTLVAGLIHRTEEIQADSATVIALLWPIMLFITLLVGIRWILLQAVRVIGGKPFREPDYDPL